MHQAEARLLAIRRQTLETVASMLRDMAASNRRVVLVEEVNGAGEQVTVAASIVEGLRARLEEHQLAVPPARMYRTRQKLLPLVLQLGSAAAAV